MFKSWLPPLITGGVGVVEKGIDFLYNEYNKDSEKQWWYEQQKYLEEHNSPAYQSMLRRKAGLNPYDGLDSVPLGNVNSSLPNSPLSNIDQSALSQSLMVNSIIEKNEADAHKSNVESGLISEKIKTESEWRSNIIQQTLNLQQAFDLGLITKEERQLRLDELKKAYQNGYNSYIIEQELAESTKSLNDSIISLNEVKEGKEYQETLNLAVQYASQTFKLALDRFFEPLMREAELDGVSLDNKFKQEEFKEFLDTQDVRVSLLNVQKAFAKLAVDEATRQDAISKLRSEYDKYIAETILDAAKDGRTALDAVLIDKFTENPTALLGTIANIVSAFAPNITTVNRHNHYNL